MNLILSILISGAVHSAPISHAKVWTAYLTFSGLFQEKVSVLYRCRPVFNIDIEHQEKFCKNSKEWLDSRTMFCVNTGLRTESNCIDVVKQNIENRDVWVWSKYAR